MPAVATASGLPTRLGKYELLLPLAAGGMARIYIARTTGIGSFERHVVLKLITPERANDHTAVQMFLDEARLAASLNHQNVAQVFEVGEDAGIHYLAMEYVHGQDLRALLAKAGSQGTRIPLELSLTVVAGAAAGLNHAHERRTPDGAPLGIVHRDVSPSNIMIGYDGAVKLLDFGIAKATTRSVETQSGIIKGKFAYMAPEQCRGRDVDRRSDVFSLGIILYEISTQHRCFRADSDFDTMHRIVTGDVVRPTRIVQGYPQALEAIVMKALAVDINQRYQSAGLLLEAIESFAVSSRMSLSTMGLGRFMRDMFGDVSEPWLGSGLQHEVAQVGPRENTISSTDGKGSGSVQIVSEGDVAAMQASGSGDDEADYEDSDSSLNAQTILDMPHDVVDSDGDRRDWQDPKAYPSPQPVLAATVTMPPEVLEPLVRPDPGPPTLKLRPAASSPPPQMTGPPAGTQPLPGPVAHAVPPAFPPAGSGTGPAMAMPGQIPSTRHGYASPMSRADAPYPRYEPQPVPEDVSLGGGRRVLYFGLAVLVVGAAIVLGVALHSSKDEPPAQTEGLGAAGHSDDVVPPTATPAGSEVTDDFISVRVDSHPQGADVLVAGTKIGTTPFENKLRRGKTVTDLRVHLDGYLDAVSKIDLGGDFQKDVVLQPVGGDGDHAGSGKPPGGASVDDSAAKPSAAKEAAAKEAAAKEQAAKEQAAKEQAAKDHAAIQQAKDQAAKEQAARDHAAIQQAKDQAAKEAAAKEAAAKAKDSKVMKASTTSHPGSSSTAGDHPKSTTTTTPHEQKPRCQPPNAFNPYDTSCGGQPCPICK